MAAAAPAVKPSTHAQSAYTEDDILELLEDVERIKTYRTRIGCFFDTVTDALRHSITDNVRIGSIPIEHREATILVKIDANTHWQKFAVYAADFSLPLHLDGYEVESIPLALVVPFYRALPAICTLLEKHYPELRDRIKYIKKCAH